MTPLEFAAGHASLLRALALGSLGFFILTPIVVPAAIVSMPADILVRPRRRLTDRRLPGRIVYLCWHIIKNLGGLTLMVTGFLLLFLPGQGLLTIFAGALLSDLPGRRRLLRRLLSARGIKPAVNRLRERYGKEALILIEDPG